MSVTGFLNWSHGHFHTNVGLNVYAPTGYYDSDSIINLGRNSSRDPAPRRAGARRRSGQSPAAG